MYRTEASIVRDVLDIQALKRQDSKAFERFVEEYQTLVYNTLLNFLGNTLDAEDLAQDVFVKAYHALPDFREESKLSTWLYRMSVNMALEHIRAQKRMKRQAKVLSLLGVGDNPPIDVPDFNHLGILLENRERAEVLHKAVSLLPEKQMVAYRLRHFDQLTYEEVAQVMQTSKSSVESLLFRAKAGLKKKLRDYYHE